MKIYISGGITNVPDYSKRFATADARLRNEGHEPINPAAIGESLQSLIPFELEYDDFMAVDEILLRMCDGIYMLRGYEKSEGAKRELQIATKAGMKIFYEDKAESPTEAGSEEI